ncbi:MAG: DUF4097 domain-containing protein [Planctomycetes bacterium]|nr:DUF4097 domain-containing protein [Planctomycetota bacterium]
MSALSTLLLAAVATFGRRDTVRTLEQPLPPAATSYRIQHAFVQCTVHVATPGQPPRARLELAATGGPDAAEERRWLERCGLELDGATATLRTTFPPTEGKPEALSFAGSLAVWLPAGADVELESRFGAVTVDGPIGRVTVRSTFSAVAVSGAQGDVDVRGENGAISVRDLKGGAQLVTRSASITAERVGGHVDARTRGGFVRIQGAGSAHAENLITPVELLQVKGDATVIAPFSEITARDVGGGLTIDGGNAALVIERVGGSLRVQHRNGKVDVRGVTGSVTVQGNLSTISVADIGGDVEVRNPSGAVKIARVDGKLVAENSSLALDLSDLRGDVDARTNGGLLRARFGKLPGDGRAHELLLEAAGGQIELDLPADASVELELVSTSGQLDVGWEGMKFTQGGGARIGVQRIGDGKAKLKATCVGGPVKARRTGS